MPRVLIGCEFSGIVRDAFSAVGWDAWSCDLLPTERPGNHITGNVLAILGDNWDLAIFFPPCTYLTRSGWQGEPRRQAAFAAAEFFRALLNAPIPKIALENPKPISHVHLPAPQQTIQPWQFGHGETKATCLWLNGLPLLKPTQIVSGREPRVRFASPGPNRWKERSRTLAGVARAMAAQWGTL